jgi:glycosyltransferase involved in cell wall biosynthesis
MRILRIAQEIYPIVVGGGAYHAHALSRDQAKKGHNVTVLTINPNVDEIQTTQSDGYELIHFPSAGQLLGNDFSIKMYNYIKNNINAYDICHAHAHFYFSSNIGAIMRGFSDTPLAITNHSLISQSVPTIIAKAHLYTLGRYTFNRSDLIFCYTKEEKRKLQSLKINSPINVISNGIDHHRFSPEGTTSSKMTLDGINILFVGRLVSGKRPQDLIKSFSRLHNGFENLTLYICGEGPLRSSLESSVNKFDIQESVKFLGHVKHDEMPQIYRSSDIFALPSRSEGFPRTILEALATETPVIGSALSQTKQTIKNGGKVFNPGDVDGLTRRLKELLRNEEMRTNLGKNGRNYIIQKGYTWEETVKNTTSDMVSLIGE